MVIEPTHSSGTRSPIGATRTWPDQLFARLTPDDGHPRLAVVNEGIGCNRLIWFECGPSGLQRFERDWLGLIRDHHAIHGSAGTGRITAANPREGFVGDDPEQGLFVHPTIVDGVRVDDDLANTETFGPLVGVASFGDFDEAMALANNHGYGLSASIYTTNPQHAFRYRERISAGMVSVNNSTSGAEAHLPFGGNGKSGNGSRQSGMWVLDQFTRWQALNWDYAGKLQRAQMDVADISGDPDFRLED